MKDITEISELNKWLSDLPQIIKYKDGDAIVNCQLVFYYCKDYYGDERKWVAAYHCSEYDYHLMCGYGVTLVEAINHLRKVLKDYRKHRDEGYVRQ